MFFALFCRATLSLCWHSHWHHDVSITDAFADTQSCTLTRLLVETGPKKGAGVEENERGSQTPWYVMEICLSTVSLWLRTSILKVVCLSSGRAGSWNSPSWVPRGQHIINNPACVTRPVCECTYLQECVLPGGWSPARPLPPHWCCGCASPPAACWRSLQPENIWRQKYLKQQQTLTIWWCHHYINQMMTSSWHVCDSLESTLLINLQQNQIIH